MHVRAVFIYGGLAQGLKLTFDDVLLALLFQGLMLRIAEHGQRLIDDALRHLFDDDVLSEQRFTALKQVHDAPKIGRIEIEVCTVSAALTMV